MILEYELIAERAENENDKQSTATKPSKIFIIIPL